MERNAENQASIADIWSISTRRYPRQDNVIEIYDWQINATDTDIGGWMDICCRWHSSTLDPDRELNS